jgi:hypothetical protein
MLLIATGTLSFAAPVQADEQTPKNFQPRPAIFKVTTDVVNPDVQPFTVTGPAFGNTLKRDGRGGFEPATFRTKLTATQDSDNRIYSNDQGGVNFYDVYQSGYLDGAEVHVYRMVGGEIKLVRETTIAEGGTVIEEWTNNRGDIIPPTVLKAQTKWQDWSRPHASRWYTVFAIDQAGNLSEAATPLKFERQQATKGVKEKNKKITFRPKNNGDTSPPLAPQNFRGAYNAEGVLEFTWDAVNTDDLAGYRLTHTDTDPATHRGMYLQLGGAPASPEKAIKVGDMIIVNKELADYSPDWISNRVGNLPREVEKFYPNDVPKDFAPNATPGKTWKLVKHPANTPVPNAGEYYFEMTLREGDTELVGKSGIPDISTTQQDYYSVPESGQEYIMEVWMKADRAKAPPVVFTWDGDKRVGSFVGAHELQLTTEWQKYEVRFIGQAADEGFHAYFVLKTSGPATYSFDNFRVYATDADYLDYRDYQYANLKRSGMAAFRTHGPIKTFSSTYSMRQYLGAPGEAEGIPKGNTLVQSLRMMEKAEVLPWLQIEMHMNPEEWLGFMEYMAAPYDPTTDTKETKPWAYLRYEQGHQAPWMDSFVNIYFEISNETWNGLFRPWTFNSMVDATTGATVPSGKVYAKFHDYVVEILRSSPYWKPEHEETFIHVLGGWSTSLSNQSMTSGFTQEIAQATRFGEFITIGAYNGGWDEGEGPPQENPASYFNVLTQVNQTIIPRIVRLNEVIEIASDRLGHEIKFGTYEAGPGYAMNGLNNAKVSKEQKISQENVMKSKLAGTATIDSFLARTYRGSDIENFFIFAEGVLWKSHAKKFRGGQSHASFIPLELFNNLATGDMLKTETKSVTTVDTVASRGRISIDDGPLAAIYATRDGDQVNIICISRVVPGYPEPNDDGDTPFGVELPFNQADSITLYRLTGKPTDHNIYEEKVQIESIAINPNNLRANGQFVINSNTGAEKGLPASETYLYVFKGTNIGPQGKILSLEETRSLPTTFTSIDDSTK